MSAILNPLAFWAALIVTAVTGLSFAEAYMGCGALPCMFSDVNDAWLAVILGSVLAAQCWHLYFVTQPSARGFVAKAAPAPAAALKHPESSCGCGEQPVSTPHRDAA